MKQFFKFFIFPLTICAISCSQSNRTPIPNYSIEEKYFGSFEGKKVTEYTITNPKGMQVSIINYGGAISRILVPDKNGKPGDIVTGFENMDGYLQKNVPFFGSLIGRYGNRIANARFTLEGKEYKLVANNGLNTLHGGNGFDKKFWNIERLAGDSCLKLTYLSKDGEEGFPGNLAVTVFYTLASNNELKIEYNASTDKTTVVNLTSHAYFNLSAWEDSTILNHELLLNADKYTPVDSVLIPTGRMEEVKEGPMGFTISKKIGKDIAKVPGGYDHNWVLNKEAGKMSLAAILYHAGTGRQMEVYTTEPGIQFYTGNFLDGTLLNTKDGVKYGKQGALCLETQHFPDSPNHPEFPGTTLKPGDTYHHICIYKFTTR